MKPLESLCLRVVHWSSWPLLAVLLAFFLTGYCITGSYGLSAVTDEKTALAWHRLLHLPLALLTLVHTLPAVYLAMRRWGWINR